MSGKIKKVKEFSLLTREIESLKNIYSNIDSQYSEFGVGCRVLCRREEYTVEGRVVRIKSKNEFAINRDGYKSEMIYEREELENLSVGLEGELERVLWLKEKEKEKLKKEIEHISIDYLEFGVDCSFEELSVVINVHEVKGIMSLNAWVIVFNIENKSIIKKVIVSEKIFNNLGTGKYIVKFILGSISRVSKLG